MKQAVAYSYQKLHNYNIGIDCENLCRERSWSPSIIITPPVQQHKWNPPGYPVGLATSYLAASVDRHNLANAWAK